MKTDGVKVGFSRERATSVSMLLLPCLVFSLCLALVLSQRIHTVTALTYKHTRKAQGTITRRVFFW
jgi:hypothetical protein